MSKVAPFVNASDWEYEVYLDPNGDLKRASQKYKNLHDLYVKQIMTKNPLSVDRDMLAIQSLNLMNEKRITSLLVHKNNKKNKTIGVLHIHKVLENIQ